MRNKCLKERTVVLLSKKSKKCRSSSGWRWQGSWTPTRWMWCSSPDVASPTLVASVPFQVRQSGRKPTSPTGRQLGPKSSHNASTARGLAATHFLLPLLSPRVENYTPDLPRESVDSAIEKALKVWEAVTPLTFSRLSEGEADIMISFAAGGNEVLLMLLIWCLSCSGC